MARDDSKLEIFGIKRRVNARRKHGERLKK